MSNLVDATIRQALKGWVDQHNPPMSGRKRLLLLAATSTSKTAHIPSFRKFDRPAPSRGAASLATSMVAEVVQSPWLWMFQVA
jgi:hypothetical protein